MNLMKYKGYAARIEFDANDRIFVGHVAEIRDIVGFHGSSVNELETAFHEAVDDYLAACAKLGQQPHAPARPRYSLGELLSQCDAPAEVSAEDPAWLASKAVGRELL